MSVPTHRAAHTHRPRRWRAASALVATAALSLAMAGIAAADDTIKPDGDTGSDGPQISYSGADCASRGDAVHGQIKVSYNGNSSGHFSAGESLTVTFKGQSGGPLPTGVTVTPGVIPTVPGDWGGTDQVFYIPFTTTVSTSSAGGKVEVTVLGNNSHYDAGAESGNGKPSYQVIVDCTTSNPGPTNHAPVVSLTTDPGSVYESQTPVTFNFTIADDAADTTWTTLTGFPSCGDFGVLVGTPVVAAAGSFQCKFPDGLENSANSTSTVAIKVADAGQLQSNTSSVDVAVKNADPVVTTPTFAVSSVDCQIGASLGNISFDDAGVNDKAWHVSISWGDPADTVATEFDTNSAGLQSPSTTPTHVYSTPGTYTATVTVTDKDKGVGSKATADGAGLQVLQAYSTTFLQPFDGSTPSRLIVNSMKSGRVVPVKVTITDSCTGLALSDPTKVVKIASGVKSAGGGTVDAVETYADAGASSAGTNLFRYSSPFWIYNLDSKALGMVVGTCYRIDVYVDGIKATKDTYALLQPVK